MAAILCIGCGEDLTARTADRRALQGPATEHVVEAWKAMFEFVKAVQFEDDERLIADTLVSGGGVPSKAGKMCRKCFAGYARNF